MDNTIFKDQVLVSGNMQKVTVCSKSLTQECRLTLVGDYHSSLDDERGKPFSQYSARMAQYGNHDMDHLEKIFEKAHEDSSHGIVLLGDMISFPSEKGVETLLALMKNSTVPVYFIAGNHDWHYEGISGSDMAQRDEWIPKRLAALYQGRDPMNYAVEVNGVKLIMLDDSVYEIKLSQLEFIRKELADGKPALLGCHIPFYLGLPHHQRPTSYGFGNPNWCADSDPYWEIERRERWAKEGLSEACFALWREVLTAENVLGIVAGHTHVWRLDTFNNKFQLVVSSKESTQLCLGPHGILL